MLSVERTLTDRMPWLAQHPHIRRPVTSLLQRLADEERFNERLAEASGCEGFDFIERMLELQRVSYRVSSFEREHIPVDGPLVVVANHPLGMVDALVLLDLIGSVRSDVRILGNDVLTMVPQLGRLLLPVDVFGSGAARSGLRESCRALERGEALIVFPAGEVSRIGASGVRDGRWADGFVRLAQRADAPVLPVHVAARNSAAFYGLSLLAKPLSTAMLPREAAHPQRRQIGISVGPRVSATELRERSGGDSARAAALMRRHVYRLARHRGRIFGGEAPIAHPEPTERVRAELDRAELLADLSDGKQAYLLQGAADSCVLREIGRLRELTFRKVGEGTGRRRDLEPYDAYYEHLVLWDPKALRIVGAYRFGHGARILSGRGMDGLYSASLFDYSPATEAMLAQGLELGRSFIAPAYWRSRALDQLWQGIGLYLQRHADIRYLFGPVSLSVSLPREAREWIVAAHQHFFGRSGLASARQPFRIAPDVLERIRSSLAGLAPADGLGRLKNQLDALGVTMPVLYRQYVDLVSPEGVHFLDFGEDPGFSGCVDGLVMLDLVALKPAKRARYLGQR